MSKLKNISLNDLGIKSEKINKIERFGFAPEMELADAQFAFSKKKKMNIPEAYWEEQKPNNLPNMNNKFLEYINLIENIKDKPGQYLDRQAEWVKDLEPEEFTPPPQLPTKIIPLTFRKFFTQIFPQNITEFALKNPEKLVNLIAEKRNKIEKDALTWLNFVSDKQISTMICQIANYSAKGKIYKPSGAFQNAAEVIQWIINTNLKMRYETTDWNKEGAKTFSAEQGNLLIIDTSLFQKIEIAEQWENNQEKEKRKIPLPLHRVWNQFATVITFPLKNNFQFLIIDKRALVGWKDLQKLEIKYDETNSTTYFFRKMEGGFQQLTYYNSCAFICE